MHELAIAQSVIEIASRHAGGARVVTVELRVGHLRQVVPSALHFAFEVAAVGTQLEGAELKLNEVEAAGVCRDCGVETPLPRLPLACQSCGGFDLEAIRGEELVVDALEVEEIEAASGVAQRK